jgi:hypothetical protein
MRAHWYLQPCTLFDGDTGHRLFACLAHASGLASLGRVKTLWPRSVSVSPGALTPLLVLHYHPSCKHRGLYGWSWSSLLKYPLSLQPAPILAVRLSIEYAATLRSFNFLFHSGCHHGQSLCLPPPPENSLTLTQSQMVNSFGTIAM